MRRRRPRLPVVSIGRRASAALILLLLGCAPGRGAETPACGTGTHAEQGRGCRFDRDADALLRIVHVYRMSAMFELVSIAYSLDGNAPSTWTATPDTRRDPQAIEMAAPPGTHKVRVHLLYRGRGVLEGYGFAVDSWDELGVQRGRVTEVELIEYEGGTTFAPPQERPTVRWNVR